ncbi:MAG: Methyltransferase type 12 [Acidimicrobiia bacterium]|nr:Methyltransferase type 12 [Acidimicrobiia bacterium]
MSPFARLNRLWRKPKIEGDPSKQRFYGSSYFEGRSNRKPGSSGYAGYTRDSSNANVAAYLLWRFLPFTSSLDVGCAKGFLVEALLDLDYDSYGWDVSEWAVAGGPPRVRERLAVVDLEKGVPEQRSLPSYSLVTALEVLEHLQPERVASVLADLRSICSGYLVATIPSLGPNQSGPGGFPDGKVRTERLAEYHDKGPGYEGPVPYDDLMMDDDGFPVQGHLTIASFSWWTRQFEAAGFKRLHDTELKMHPVIGRFDLSVAWNLYVFHVDNATPAAMVPRSEIEIAELERKWKLADRPLGVHSQNLTNMTMGPSGVEAIESEFEASQLRKKLV